MKKHFLICLLAIIVYSFSSCKKKSCITLKCGYVVVTDPNYGSQTIAQSTTACSTQVDWDKAISDFHDTYSSSGYDIRFRESSTKEDCSK